MKPVFFLTTFALLVLSACSGNNDVSVPVNSQTGRLADDGNQNIVTLSIGEMQKGKFGFYYGTEQLQRVRFDLSACSGTATINVQGYDIDKSTEIQVFSGDVSIGYLSRGKGNNRLNSGDIFVVDNTKNDANTLTFQQTRVNEKWGVTNILLSSCETTFTGGSSDNNTSDPQDQPPEQTPEQPTTDQQNMAPVLSGVVDTNRYGHNYGSSESYSNAQFSFYSDSNVRRLLVSGYDINSTDEVSVWLNSQLIGYLSRGRKKKLNGGDTFTLPISLQNEGQNSVVFRQKSAGGTWGVTNLSLESVPGSAAALPVDGNTEDQPEINPPDTNEPVTDLILLTTTLNKNEYGHQYGSNSHERAASFAFNNTGADTFVSVYGFDIDTKKEVQVELNGNLIGHLTKGANQSENGGDVILLPIMDQLAGENIVTFSQSKNAGEPWGVTNIQMMGCVKEHEVYGTPESSGVSKVIDPATGTLIFSNFFNGSAITNGTDRYVSVCVSERDGKGNRFAHFTTNVGQDDNTAIKAYPEFIIGSKFGLTNETSFRPYPTLVSTEGFKYPILEMVADVVGLPTFTYNIPDIDVVIDIDEQNVIGSIRDVMLESWFYDTSANPESLGYHANNSTDWSPGSDVTIPESYLEKPYFYQGGSIHNTLNNIVGSGHPDWPKQGNVLLEMMVHVGPLSPNDVSETSRHPSQYRLTEKDKPVTIGDYKYHIWYGSTHIAPLVVYSRETNAQGQSLLNLTEEGEINLDWNLFLDYTLESLEPQLAAKGVAWAQGAENVFPRMRAKSGAIGSLEFGVEPQTNNLDDEPYRATVRRFEVLIRDRNFGL